MAVWKTIGEDMSCLPFSVSPLSADILRIRGSERTWLFDVGAAPDALQELRQLSGPTAVVISHFHPDHMANLAHLQPDNLYLGKYTFEKTGRGTVIDRAVTVEDGHRFRLFPLPSSHAKGCIGLEVDDRYALLGDGAYATAKEGRVCYNATLLKDTIDCLSRLKAPYFLLSHAEPILQRREDVLDMLTGVYAQRTPACPDIYPR